MKVFGWSKDYINDDLNGAEGWVYYYWALEHEAGFWGGQIEFRGGCYVKQEYNEILARR